MASISLSAVVPAYSPFDTVAELTVPTKPIHNRRRSRNPSLIPLTALDLSPGATESMGLEKQISSTAAGKEDAMETHKTTRKVPAPLPAFSFNPGAMIESGSESSSPAHPVLEAMAQNTARRSSKPAALPTFSFNPGADGAPTTPSPTKSSFSPDPPTLARSVGYRRGTGEFVGAIDEAQVSTTPPLSISPQKGSLGPPVTSQRSAHFTHQHRRSQAVSVTEIETSELIKANAVAKHRAGVMPSTPTNLPFNDRFSRASHSISSLNGRTPPTSPRRRASATGTRPRVGFADTVDVIPRPLSMISSDTEGSTSTVRGNHSLTGSITSFGSPPSQSNLLTLDDYSSVQRPISAGAASLSCQNPSSSGESSAGINLPKRPLSVSDTVSTFTSSSNHMSKRRFWFTSGGSAEASPNPTPLASPSFEVPGPMTVLTPLPLVSQSTSVLGRPKTSPERRASMKKRKGRRLAGVIFSRKRRSRAGYGAGRRTPTPPLTRPDVLQKADVVFDNDNTVVIRDSPSLEEDRLPTPPRISNIALAGTPSFHESDAEDRVTNPVIDLDAALGPFGSGDRTPPSGFAAARSRMHSSMGRGIPDAFGVIHGRAESAPQVPPINRSTFSVHRYGSNTDITEDVFDEEEEDDFLVEEAKPKDASIPTQDVEGTEESISIMPHALCHSEDHSGLGRRQVPRGLSISTDISHGIEIVDEDHGVEEAARSSDSTLTGPLIIESEKKRPTSSAMPLAYPAPQISYASSGEGRSAPGSAISSPDADHVAFDTYPRFSRYMRESSPDHGLWASAEDVPSLCDSVSTGNAPRNSSSAVTRSSADQPSGLFSPSATGRSPRPQQTWKRASLGSLNKLLPGSLHGENIRLRFEESVAHEQAEKLSKRGNRISRLMSFWRSKGKETKA